MSGFGYFERDFEVGGRFYADPANADAHDAQVRARQATERAADAVAHDAKVNAERAACEPHHAALRAAGFEVWFQTSGTTTVIGRNGRRTTLAAWGELPNFAAAVATDGADRAWTDLLAQED